MCDFKFLIYFSFIVIELSLISWAYAENKPVSDPETSIVNSKTEETLAEVEKEKILFTLTPEKVKERQQAVTQMITTLQKESANLKKEETAFQKKLVELANIQEVTTEQVEEATKQREVFSQNLENLRLERAQVETNLTQQNEQLTQLKGHLDKLQQLPAVEQTKEVKTQQTELKQNLALLGKAIATEQQYLVLLKEQIGVVLNLTMLAIEWHLQLQVKQANHLISEREQAVASTQAMLQEQEQALLTMQADMPNQLTSLQTTQTSVEQLQQTFEKATLDKESAEVELKNLRLEQTNIESNLAKQTQLLEELQQEIEALKKAPPTEPEQLPLHGKRVSELENRLNLQTKVHELEQQSLTIVSQQLKQAEKKLELTTQWYSQLVPIFQARQRQELESQLQQEKQTHLSHAVELRWQLNKLPTSPEYTLQRYLLQVQIQQANEQAEQLSRKLKFQYVKEQLNNWQEQVSDKKKLVFSPGQVEKFQTWMDELNIILTDLNTSQNALKGQIMTLGKQQKFVEKRKEGLSAEQLQYNDQASQLLTKLKNSLQQEIKDLAPLLANGEQLLTIFEKKYQESVRLSLFRQRQLPINLGEWKTLFGEIITFPKLFLQQLQLTWRDSMQALEQVQLQQVVTLGISSFIWLVVVLFLWLSAKSRQFISKGSGFMALLLRLFQANTLGIAVVGLVLLFLWLTAATAFAKTIILMLLFVGIMSKLFINLSWLLLLSRDIKSVLPIQLYRQLRWTTIFIAIFAVITLLVHVEHEAQTIKLSLTARDFVDSLFMLFLGLTILPLLRARRVIFMICAQVKLCTIASFLILVIAFIISIVSVLGIIGYLSLGWSVAHKLSLFLVVLVSWLFFRGLLHDVIKLWKNAALKDELYGSLWAEDFIPLMEQMLSLILVVLAGFVFLKITGWYSDVAFQQNTEHFLKIPLFSIGATKLTISSILLAIFLSWLVWWLGNWARGVSYRWAYSGIIDMGVRSSLSVFTQYAIVLLGLLIILKGIGIDPTVLSVFVGALGVGIGFGLQNIIHNFVSGILILLERPVRTGDFISIGSFIGTVQRVGINSLTIETLELEEVRVPNSEIISQIFVNRTSNNDLFRKSLFIGIHYDSNLELAAEIIKKILDQHAGVQKKPAYNIYTWEVTEFRINIRVDYFVDTQRSNSLRIHSDILSQIIAQFKEAGIKIPYPQSEVYLNSTSPQEEPGNLITVAT